MNSLPQGIMRQSTFMCLITSLPSRLLQWTAAVREIPALRRRLRRYGPHLDYLVGAGLLEKALCQTRKYQLTHRVHQQAGYWTTGMDPRYCARTKTCGSEFIRDWSVHPTHLCRTYRPLANEFAPTWVCVGPGAAGESCRCSTISKWALSDTAHRGYPSFHLYCRRAAKNDLERTYRTTSLQP